MWLPNEFQKSLFVLSASGIPESTHCAAILTLRWAVGSGGWGRTIALEGNMIILFDEIRKQTQKRHTAKVTQTVKD